MRSNIRQRKWGSPVFPRLCQRNLKRAGYISHNHVALSTQSKSRNPLRCLLRLVIGPYVHVIYLLRAQGFYGCLDVGGTTCVTAPPKGALAWLA
jgi:hypothetical protein